MPNWAVAVAVAALLAGSYWLGHRAGSSSVAARWEQDRARHEQALAQAQARARDIEREALRAREIIETNHRAAVARTQAAVSAARGELGRLRAALAERERRAAEDAAATGEPDGAAPERELLGACAQEYQRVAGEADEIAERLRALQAYVRAIAQPEVP